MDRRRWQALAALAVATSLLGAACSGSDDEGEGGSGATATTASATDGAAPGTSTPDAVAIDYSDRGPYEVGTTRVTLGDREAIVFYPTSDEAAAAAEPVTVYSSGDAFDPALRETVAGLVPEFVQDIPLDAYADAVIDEADAPFPVILHSHGAGGSYLFSSQHYEHLASWGMVVAAPDHKSRNLSAGATGGGGEGPSDVEDLQALLVALDEANAGDGPLAGGLDLEQLGAEGHSAGGRAVVQLAADPAVGIQAVIGWAPAPPIDFRAFDPEATPEERAGATAEALAAQQPPAVNSLIVPAEKDQVIPLAPIQAEYEWLAPPKRLVVLANAGHNAFTDVCKPIREQGGLTKYAEALPSFAPLFTRGEDGCTEADLDPQLGFDVMNHLAVAHFRWALGFDATDASLQAPFLEATFPGAIGDVEFEG